MNSLFVMWHREPITAPEINVEEDLFFSPSSPFSLMLAIFPRVDWLSLKLNAGTVFFFRFILADKARQTTTLTKEERSYALYLIFRDDVR